MPNSTCFGAQEGHPKLERIISDHAKDEQIASLQAKIAALEAKVGDTT